MPNSDLRELDDFLAIARTLNFRRAAIAQGVSVAGLSQRVRALEARLGVRLFNRTTRSVALTEAGELLFAQVAPALHAVSDALDQVRGLRGVPAGRLRINAPAPAVDLVLAPMIAPFLAACPRVELEIVVETAFVDIVGQGFDAGIRYGEHLARDVIAVPLGGPQRYALAAAPGLIAKDGWLKHPKDLLTRTCLRTRFPSGVELPWEFEKAGRVVKISPRGPLLSSHLNVLMRAAVEGLGYVVTFEGYIRDEVKAGRLVIMLDDWLPPFPGPFLYYPSRRQPPPALAAFLTFAADWRKRSKHLH